VIGYCNHQPDKHLLKPKAPRSEHPCALSWQRYHFSMKPYPHVPENQGHSHEQQPQHWVASAAPDSGLVELPVGGLNTEASTVGLSDPTQGAVSDSPGGIKQRFPLMPVPLTIEVAAHHRQVKADFPFLRAAEGISGPVAAFGLGNGLRARGASWLVCLLASLDCWHDEGLFATDEILNDSDAVEAPVQQEQAHLDSQGSKSAHQHLKHLYHLVPFADSAHGEGVATATEDHIGGGVGEEMSGPGGSLASAYLVFMLGLDPTMIRDPNQVNGDPPSLEAQPFGQKLGQELVDLFLKLIQVFQLTGQFSQDSGSRRCSLKVLARLVDGDRQGRGKDQDIEKVVNLDMTSSPGRRLNEPSPFHPIPAHLPLIG
jgi:hypothetical protein